MSHSELITVQYSLPFGLTLVSPGGSGHSIGSVGGDLQEKPQKHSQHAKSHVGL